MNRRLKLLAVSLALTTFLPATPTFAAEEPVQAEEVAAPTEEVSASKEEVANPDETAVEAETNVDYLNYLELEDFIISAERIPTNKWDTPANVAVITSQEIEDNHYQSIGEALSHVNGLFIGNGIFMNGGNRVLVLIDGHRRIDPQINEQVTKAYTGIPSMKMVERIEVLKGGNSALYGSDAFSGVINIVTKKGTKNETSIDLNTGTWRQHNYEIANQGSIDKFSWFVTGRLYKAHPTEYKSGLAEDFWQTDTSENSQHNFSVRLDQRFTERDSLTFDAMNISGKYRYYSHYWHDYDNRIPTSREIINNLSLTYNFKEGTSTPGWLRYVHNYYKISNAGTENPHARLQGIEYQNGWELGQHKIIAGLEWHKSTATNRLYGYDVDMNTKSIYLQDTISMGDKWTIIPGVRYDHSSEFGGNWSPKIAANYRPDERTKFYASWGRSYNVPLLSELYSLGYPDLLYNDPENYLRLTHGGVPTFYYGNRNLKPEKGNSFILGIEHDFDEKSGMTLSFFQNKMKNRIFWTFEGPYQFSDTGEDFYVSKAYNTKPIKSRGIELTYHQKIDDHFSYNLGYSHTHRELEGQNGKLSFYTAQPNGYRLGLSYKNRGLKMNLQGVMASGINTNLYAAYWSDTNVTESYPKRRYAVFDFNLSYDVNDNLTFYFKALNFTNQHYSNVESTNYGYKQVYPGSSRQFIYGVNCKF